MQPPQVDGLAVLPELTDDAILISNLLKAPLRGREKIARVLHALDDYFIVVSDIERINTASHKIIDSRALLPFGGKVQIQVFGTRNDQGWISEVLLILESDKALPQLAKIIADASH
ncbi:MAG: hypothetical protein QM647_12420 [Asticcacaulis sp.]|uniref:hypothetical protein n=1 Tax=Asticcacaulis sp. TaxID=1872648 RepID=UPI0039E4D978